LHPVFSNIDTEKCIAGGGDRHTPVIVAEKVLACLVAGITSCTTLFSISITVIHCHRSMRHSAAGAMAAKSHCNSEKSVNGRNAAPVAERIKEFGQIYR
jgi:hypothetical protein